MEDATAEKNISDLEITEYDQPETSRVFVFHLHYSTPEFWLRDIHDGRTNPDSLYAETIILSFREEKQEYPVPRQFIEKLPSLAAVLEPDTTHLSLELVEEDMTHTVVHYLDTGDFQTLHDPSSKGMRPVYIKVHDEKHGFAVFEQDLNAQRRELGPEGYQ